jgi:hypothetical protein
MFTDLVDVAADVTLTTPGRLTFRRENGLSYNALGPFQFLVEVMLLSLSTMLCMYMVGVPLMEPT